MNYNYVFIYFFFQLYTFLPLVLETPLSGIYHLGLLRFLEEVTSLSLLDVALYILGHIPYLDINTGTPVILWLVLHHIPFKHLFSFNLSLASYSMLVSSRQHILLCSAFLFSLPLPFN